MHVGYSNDSAMRQTTLAIHANVQLPAEIPLPALLGLVHLGVPGRVFVLAGAGCAKAGGASAGANCGLSA
jgi:hypothetical protein